MKPVWIDEDDTDLKKLNNKKSIKAIKRINKGLNDINLKINNENKNEDGSQNNKSMPINNIQNILENNYKEIKQYTSKYKWADNNDLSKLNNSVINNNKNLNALERLLKTSQNLSEEVNSTIKKERFNNIYKTKEVKGYITKEDLNKGHVHNSRISNVEFHPYKSNIAVTSGLDRCLKIFNINNKLDINNTSELSSNFQQVSLLSIAKTNDLPIYSSKFISLEFNNNGYNNTNNYNKNISTEIIISGRRKHFFTYNIEKEKLTKNVLNVNLIKSNTNVKSLERLYTRENSNNFAFTTLEGDVFIFDSKTKIYKNSLKINGSVTSVVLNTVNDNYIYCSSNSGEIFLFDVRKHNNCINKINDEGSFNTLSMDMNNKSNYLATSQSTGIVNLYNVEDLCYSSTSTIKPVKVIIN